MLQVTDVLECDCVTPTHSPVALPVIRALSLHLSIPLPPVLSLSLSLFAVTSSLP